MPLIRKPAELSAAAGAPDQDAAKAGLHSPNSDIRWAAARALAAFPEAAGVLGAARLLMSNCGQLVIIAAMFASACWQYLAGA